MGWVPQFDNQSQSDWSELLPLNDECRASATTPAEIEH